MKTSLFLATALGALLATSAANAEVIKMQAVMDGEQTGEDEPSSATGEGKFKYDDETKVLCGIVEYTAKGGTPTEDALTGDVNLAHIHSSVDGNPVFTLEHAKKPIPVNVTLTEAQETLLLSGQYYVNIHTSTFGNGEIRGDIAENEELADFDCPGTTDGGSSGNTPPPSNTPPGATPGSTPGTTPGATPPSSNSSSSGSTSDDGCSTTGTAPGSGLAIALGVGIALAAASRRRKQH